jgi:prevent-host-death family protein
MNIDLTNIYSLSDFQRNTREHIAKLKQTGTPAVLTVNGQAEVVVQSAEAYQRLVEGQELLESMRTISRSLEQAKRGEGRPMREFLESLASEHGITLK